MVRLLLSFAEGPANGSAICTALFVAFPGALALAEGIYLFWWEPTAAPTRVWLFLIVLSAGQTVVDLQQSSQEHVKGLLVYDLKHMIVNV